MFHGLHLPLGIRPRDSSHPEHQPLPGHLQCCPEPDAWWRELAGASVQVGGQPIVFDRVKGPYAWDVDGNKYIDYIGSWGPPSAAMPIPK